MSYAAFLWNKQVPDEYVEEYKKLLLTFHELSIREISGQKIVRNLIERETELSRSSIFIENRRLGKTSKEAEIGALHIDI